MGHLHTGAIMVTSNVRDIRDIPELEIEHWLVARI